MQVCFYGVRGSVSVSGPRFLAVGGNTPCVALEHEGHRLVLDGGTGLAALGAALGPGPQRLMLLFSHVHWDHVQGVPFFGPLFHPDSQIAVAGARRAGSGIREALDRLMQPPGFPIRLDALRARLQWADVAGAFDYGPFHVQPLELAHPDGALAFRVEAGGRSVVYATDHEPAGQLDPALLGLCEGADLLIHDAQYTPEEYAGQAGPSRRGWGHATVDEATAAARAAAVGQLALFHHDPGRSDEGVFALEAAARGRFARTIAAREGAQVAL